MELKRTGIFIFAFFLGPIIIFAQTEIFAPFVSHAEARVRDRKVELTWSDSPSVKGNILIFRSRTPFPDSGSEGSEQCATVYYGRQTFTDEVNAGGNWYYLVLATTESGELFDLVIPFNNVIEVRIDGGTHLVSAAGLAAPVTSVEALNEGEKRAEEPRDSPYQDGATGAYNYNPPAYEPSAMAGAAPYQSYNPPAQSGYTSGGGLSTPSTTLALTGLSAYPDSSGIRVNFLSGNPSKHAVVYRNIAPIMRLSDLLSAEIAKLPGAESPFIDTVQTGVPCYYAVVYDEDLRAGTAYIAPGYNATIYPAMVIQGVARMEQNAWGLAQTNAPPPVASGNALQTPAAPSQSHYPEQGTGGRLSLEAAAALSGTTFGAPRSGKQTAEDKVSLSEPKIFGEDLEQAPAGTEEAALQNIVRELVLWRRWDEAADALRQYLLNNTSALASRARFYLGQSFYFSGAADKALTEFLAVQSRFPEESSLWIQACLTKLSR
jgi:hypothetical protein